MNPTTDRPRPWDRPRVVDTAAPPPWSRDGGEGDAPSRSLSDRIATVKALSDSATTGLLIEAQAKIDRLTAENHGLRQVLAVKDETIATLRDWVAQFQARFAAAEGGGR